MKVKWKWYEHLIPKEIPTNQGYKKELISKISQYIRNLHSVQIYTLIAKSTHHDSRSS